MERYSVFISCHWSKTVGQKTITGLWSDIMVSSHRPSFITCITMERSFNSTFKMRLIIILDESSN